MYNLFFKIVLKYNQDFHTHLEMFFKAILDLLYMNFNEGKSPMYIFGVDINKLYEDRKLFQNLPEFCDNLKVYYLLLGG